MTNFGKLYVFEGPDGVGKTELSARFVSLLEKRGVAAKRLAFPGMDEGTLGKVVHNLHHSPESLNLKRMAPASLQLLHIAAHLDAIESTIIPALRNGTSVVLDRFWWSTKVYGLAAGANKRLLDAMIDVELAAWGTVTPTVVFLLKRQTPLRPEPEEMWRKWTELYERLCAQEHRKTHVLEIDNNGSVADAVRQLKVALDHAQNRTVQPPADQLTLELSGRASERATLSPSVFTAWLPPCLPSSTILTGGLPPRGKKSFQTLATPATAWTPDPILSEFKFTNAYRASDRVSQFLIKNVIYEGDQAEEEVFFRIILFKLFNKIETWERLTRSLGVVCYRDFDLTHMMRRSQRRSMEAKLSIPLPTSCHPAQGFGTTRKHRAHLKLLERMMDDEVAVRIAGAKTMLEAFTLLRSYPMIGDFLAYQYVTDLNYSNLTNFSEMQFVIPGPGAKGGISKCFESLGGLTEADLIRVVTERQEQEFERLGSL